MTGMACGARDPADAVRSPDTCSPRSSMPKRVTTVTQMTPDMVIGAVASLLPGIDRSPPLPEAFSTLGLHPAEKYGICKKIASRVRVRMRADGRAHRAGGALCPCGRSSLVPLPRCAVGVMIHSSLRPRRCWRAGRWVHRASRGTPAHVPREGRDEATAAGALVHAPPGRGETRSTVARCHQRRSRCFLCSSRTRSTHSHRA